MLHMVVTIYKTKKIYFTAMIFMYKCPFLILTKLSEP